MDPVLDMASLNKCIGEVDRLEACDAMEAKIMEYSPSGKGAAKLAKFWKGLLSSRSDSRLAS